MVGQNYRVYMENQWIFDFLIWTIQYSTISHWTSITRVDLLYVHTNFLFFFAAQMSRKLEILHLWALGAANWVFYKSERRILRSLFKILYVSIVNDWCIDICIYLAGVLKWWRRFLKICIFISYRNRYSVILQMKALRE